jgi:hypothetical protein
MRFARSQAADEGFAVEVGYMGHHSVFLDFLERLGEEVSFPSSGNSGPILMDDQAAAKFRSATSTTTDVSAAPQPKISLRSSTAVKDLPLYQCNLHIL